MWALAQRRAYAAKQSTIAEVIDVIKQFASERRKNVLKYVALDVLERARLFLEGNGGYFQHPKMKRSRR